MGRKTGNSIFQFWEGMLAATKCMDALLSKCKANILRFPGDLSGVIIYPEFLYTGIFFRIQAPKVVRAPWRQDGRGRPVMICTPRLRLPGHKRICVPLSPPTAFARSLA